MSMNSDWTFIDLLGSTPDSGPSDLQILSLDDALVSGNTEEQPCLVERESSESPSLITHNDVEPNYLGIITVSDTEGKETSNDDEEEEEEEEEDSSTWMIRLKTKEEPARLVSQQTISVEEEADEKAPLMESPSSVSHITEDKDTPDLFPSPPPTPRTPLTSSLEFDKDSLLNSSLPDILTTTKKMVDVAETESLVEITNTDTSNGDSDAGFDKVPAKSYSADFLSFPAKPPELSNSRSSSVMSATVSVSSSTNPSNTSNGSYKNSNNNNNITCTAVWFSMVLCILYSSVSALMGIFIDVGRHGPEGLVHTNPSIDRLATAQAHAALLTNDHPIIPASKSVTLLLNTSSLIKIEPKKAAKPALVFKTKIDPSMLNFKSDDDSTDEDEIKDDDKNDDNDDSSSIDEDDDREEGSVELLANINKDMDSDGIIKFNEEIKSLMNTIDRDYHKFEKELIAEQEEYEKQLRELSAAIARGNAKQAADDGSDSSESGRGRSDDNVKTAEPPSDIIVGKKSGVNSNGNGNDRDKQSLKKHHNEPKDEVASSEDNKDDENNLMDEVPLLDGFAYISFIVCIAMMSVGCVISLVLLVACLGLLTKQWNLTNLANVAMRNGLGMHGTLIVQPSMNSNSKQLEYDDYSNHDYYHNCESLLPNMLESRDKLGGTLIHRSTAMNKKC